MLCPNCNETLLITERKNVEIDYCPKCRGVWLDKGELDKIIEFSMVSESPAPPPPRPTPNNFDNPRRPEYKENNNWKKYDDDDDDDYKRGQYSKPGQKKKSSFLGDLFDF